MTFEDLIARFGEKLKLELSVQDGATCSLEVDGMSVTLHNLAEVDSVAIVGDVGEPPPERLEGLYKAMLNANHMFRGTMGSTISLDPETGSFTLCRTLSMADVTDVEMFSTLFESFVNVLETWRRIVAEYRENGVELEKATNDTAAAAMPDGPAQFGGGMGLGSQFMSV